MPCGGRVLELWRWRGSVEVTDPRLGLTSSLPTQELSARLPLTSNEMDGGSLLTRCAFGAAIPFFLVFAVGTYAVNSVRRWTGHSYEDSPAFESYMERGAEDWPE